MEFKNEIAIIQQQATQSNVGVIRRQAILNELNIQKKSVKLGSKIKTTGEYSVDIDLHPEVNCSLDIEILSPKTSD